MAVFPRRVKRARGKRAPGLGATSGSAWVIRGCWSRRNPTHGQVRVKPQSRMEYRARCFFSAGKKRRREQTEHAGPWGTGNPDARQLRTRRAPRQSAGPVQIPVTRQASGILNLRATKVEREFTG